MNIFRRSLPLILVLAMLVGLLIPAAAAQITLGQPVSVNVVDDETPVIFQFVPQKSGYYTFYSFRSDGWDPYGYILNSAGDLLAEGDDTEDSMDFSIDCYMTAGDTYTLAATCYSGSAAYSVQLDALPSPTSMEFDQAVYSGGIRNVILPQVNFFPRGSAQEMLNLISSDEQIVTIGEEGELHLGLPGTATVTATSLSGLKATCTVTVQEPEQISLDTPWIMDAVFGNEQYLRFTAPSSGWYGIHSAGDEIDTEVEILDENLDGLNSDDDTLPNENFFAPVYLEANQLCYFSIKAHCFTGTAQITLQKLAPATSITLPQNRITGYVDTVCRLEPVYAPQISIPEELNWKSSNENVVYVDQSGYVSFLEPGNAVITATSETGKTASTAVTVLSAPNGSDLLGWGICGPNLQWQLKDTGVLTVTGSGEMYDLYDNECHWDAFTDRITRVVLPEGMTTIGYGAFLYCSELTEVDIPHSVRHIGGSAFSFCTALNRVTLPENLETMGSAAFEYCWTLKEMTLPDSLQRIPFNAFIGCSELTQVTLSENLISIGDYAFADCPIAQLRLPDSLKTVGYCGLSGTNLTELILPEGLTELRDYALANCAIEELTVPATVTKLGCGFTAGTPLHTVHFLGNAPELHPFALDYLEITAYYPAANQSWTEDIRQDYGGAVTWIAEGNPGVTLTGSAPEGAALTLLETSETVTAEQGSYCFSNLLPGAYTLVATAPNRVTRTYNLTVGAEDLIQEVSLCLIGDADGNGKLNIGDVAKLNAHITGSAAITDEYLLLCANVNGGSLNMGDTASLYAHVRGTKKLY